MNARNAQASLRSPHALDAEYLANKLQGLALGLELLRQDLRDERASATIRGMQEVTRDLAAHLGLPGWQPGREPASTTAWIY